MKASRGIASDKSVCVRGRVEGISDLTELALIACHGGISFLLCVRFLFFLGVQHFHPFDMEIIRRRAVLVRIF